MRDNGRRDGGRVSFLLALVLLVQSGCVTVPSGPRWFRGNTHAHTTNSDGNATPQDAAAWYKSRGYAFLCITDHNFLTNAGNSKQLETVVDDGFIVIPSEEITQTYIHTCALNIDRQIPAFYEQNNVDVLRKNLELTERASGILIVNHPNWRWAPKTEDLLATEGIVLFELYNCSSTVNNEGGEMRPSTEEMWDILLTAGKVLYAVASDDTTDYTSKISRYTKCPGRGWITVRADALSPDSICSAMEAGHFYASIGVHLSTLECSVSRVVVAIDQETTERELASGTVLGRPARQDARVGERIDFIGTGGRLLRSVEGSSAEYVPTEKGYVRARAVVTREVDGELREYCAWAQPVFIP